MSFLSSSFGQKALDFLIPPLCLGCDASVTADQTLCAECWKAIHFIERPFCARCGAPFDLPVEEGTLCAACLAEEPPYDLARSAILYDEASKPIILRFKHADRLHPVPALGAWMVRAGADIWPIADLIVPVPLHRWRLWRRRYNQAALLAQAIGKALGKQVAIDLLVRHRATPSQGRMNKKERHENVSGAFALSSRAEVAGKRIVLIDDVLTSGATVAEAAKILKKNGAAAVHVVTLARARLAT